MRPPADRTLELNGGTDVPAFTARRDHIGRRPIVIVATGLGILSTTLAWQFMTLSGRTDASLVRVAALNFAWWYLWALFAPGVIWLSRRARIERGSLRRAAAVHLPAVVIFSCAHIAMMQAAQWWLARSERAASGWWHEVQRSAVLYLDWEMMTYWAIVGVSHALLYYRESEARALRTAYIERQLIETRLALFQQQLQPHFLFNALNTVVSLMHKDVRAAEHVLVRVGDLLRLTLENSGRREVPLEAEVDSAARYAEIERIRFADRLTVRFDIAPETLPALVPALLLQPLVENAVKHGVARKAGPGNVEVLARREADKLRLEVRDDGVGLSEDALTALQKGIGVSTTRARLQDMFGADFRFEFHRLPQGLSVVVAVPWRVAAEAPPSPAPGSAPDAPRASERTGDVSGAPRDGAVLYPARSARVVTVA